MKRMSSSELRTAISGMKHTEVIYEDDLSNPMTNQQASKSKLRQALNGFVDRASCNKEKILIIRGN